MEDIGAIFTVTKCGCGEELVEIDYQSGYYICPKCDEEKCGCGEELVEIDYQPGNYICPKCDEEMYLDLVDPYRKL